jgi:hypothetical protein
MNWCLSNYPMTCKLKEDQLHNNRQYVTFFIMIWERGRCVYCMFHTDKQKTTESQLVKTWSKSVRLICIFPVASLLQRSLWCFITSLKENVRAWCNEKIVNENQSFHLQMPRIKMILITLYKESDPQKICSWKEKENGKQ